MNEGKKMSGQTEVSLKKNAQFFLEDYASYKANVNKIDTYKNVSLALNGELEGLERILDIGNGGVFDYDTDLVAEIIGLDLFLDALPKDTVLPDNVRMTQGSALDIPFKDNNFDAVLMVMLIHHLVGDTVNACEENVQKSFNEAFQAIKPGGKIVIMDSCVPQWFYLFECLVFRVASWIISKIMKHPPVLQYADGHIRSMLHIAGFDRVEVKRIPKGRYILQFGIKFPAMLTPTQPTLFVGYKD